MHCHHLIITLLLDVWVVWNVSNLEHRSSPSEDAASLPAPSGPGCLLTSWRGAWGWGSPSLPPPGHPPAILHGSTQLWTWRQHMPLTSLPRESLTASLPVIHLLPTGFQLLVVLPPYCSCDHSWTAPPVTFDPTQICSLAVPYQGILHF